MILLRKLALLLFLLVICHLCAFSQTPQTRSDPITSALRAGDFAKAAELSRAALKEFTNDPQLWALQGVALASEGDAQALAAFQQALKLSPNYVMALQGAAQLEFQAGSQDAVPLLNHLLQLRPGDPTSHAMMGVLRYLDGRGSKIRIASAFAAGFGARKKVILHDLQ